VAFPESAGNRRNLNYIRLPRSLVVLGERASECVQLAVILARLSQFIDVWAAFCVQSGPSLATTLLAAAVAAAPTFRQGRSTLPQTHLLSAGCLASHSASQPANLALSTLAGWAATKLRGAQMD